MRTIAHKGFSSIRVEETTHGLMFCAYDICNALKYDNTKYMKRSVEYIVGTENIMYLDVSGRPVMFINKDGAFKLADGADMANETRSDFKDWIMSECDSMFVPVEAYDNNGSLNVFSYDGSDVTFKNANGETMVNATQMAKAFGKRPNDWLNLQSAKEFLNELTITRKNGNADYQAVVTRKGGINPNEGGTWLSEDAAIEFARWLSPKFAIWCNDKIKELVNKGVVTVTNDDDAILYAMRVLQERVEESKRQLAIANDTIEELRPLADYTSNVLNSVTTQTLTWCAKDLGMRSVKNLVDALLLKKVLYRQSGKLLPYADYADKGYFETRTRQYIHDGNICTDKDTVVTEKGIKFLHNMFNTLF